MTLTLGSTSSSWPFFLNPVSRPFSSGNHRTLKKVPFVFPLEPVAVAAARVSSIGLSGETLRTRAKSKSKNYRVNYR